MAELGLSGLEHHSGTVTEEFLPQLQGREAIKTYREMSENDPVIGAMLFSIDMLIRQVDWRVQGAEEGGDEKDEEFLREVMDDMSHSWSDFISEVMSMLVYGWSYFEIVYKRREGGSLTNPVQSKYDDGKIGWRKFAFRSQDSIDRWEFDDNGGIKALVQKPAPRYEDRIIPIQKSLLFRTTVRKNNPEGRSALRNAYRPWFFKKRIEEIEGTGIERDLAGLPIARIPMAYLADSATTEEKAVRNAIADIVKNVRQDRQAGILWPNDKDDDGNPLFEFELMSSGGSRVFDTSSIIERYDRRVLMTCLADFILLGHEKVGSFALSSDKTDLFGVAIGAWLKSIEDVINRHAVTRLFELNGASGDALPMIKHGDIERPDIQRLAAYLQTLSGMGMPLFPDEALSKHMRDLADLPPASEEAEEASEQKQLEELRQMLMSGDATGEPDAEEDAESPPQEDQSATLPAG